MIQQKETAEYNNPLQCEKLLLCIKCIQTVYDDSNRETHAFLLTCRVVITLHFFVVMFVWATSVNKPVIAAKRVICGPAGTVNQPNPDHITPPIEQLAIYCD